MKRYLFIWLAIGNWCFAQDTITLKTGERIPSKVIEIGIKGIKYKLPDNPDSTIFFVNKDEVRQIRYKSGRMDVFNESESVKTDVMTLKTGEKILSKVVEIGITDIKYRKADSQDTTLLSVKKTDVRSIKYKSGREDIFDESEFSKADIITLRTGQKIRSKVIELGITQIKYRKVDSPDSTVFSVDKTAVQEIRYKSGRIDIFDEQPKEDYSGNRYAEGMRDASMYYPRKHTGAGGVIAAGLIFLPAGIVTAIVCSAIPPSTANLRYPDEKIFNNSATYRTGYMEEAHKMKRKKVWGAFGGVIGVYAGIIIFAITQMH